MSPEIGDIPPKQLTIQGRGMKVSLFSRQFASMVSSGVPIVQALDVLAAQEDDPRFRHCLNRISQRMCAGHAMSKCLAEYPKVFPAIFPYLTKAGENTGRIAKVLEKLAVLLEEEVNMLNKVKSALSYPFFIMGLTGVLTLIIFTTVLPSFQDFYTGMELELPLLTSMLMAVTGLLTSASFWIPACFFIATVIYLFQQSLQVKSRRLFFFSMLIQIPMVGPIVELSCLARYCWVLELTTRSGVQLMRALKLAALASGSEIIEADCNRILDGISAGETLNELMDLRPGVYPNFIRQMVLLGEETGRVAETFGRSADWFREEVETKLEVFHASIEPLLMALVSFVVGGIIVAVFLPLYGILEKLA